MVVALESSRSVRQTPRSRIMFGTVSRPQGREFPLVWDSHQVLNGHVIGVGGTGSGKTRMIRKIVRELARSGITRIHILDPHGDIIPEGVPFAATKFSASTEIGLNPLAVSPDPDFGGPRNRTNSFLRLLLRQMNLGDNQRVALSRLLMDLYRRHGFEQEQPRSWGLDFDPRDWASKAKRHPTLSDLSKHVMQRMMAMKFGTSGAAISSFEEVARQARKLRQARTKEARGENADQALEKAKLACLEAFKAGLDNIETGRELEDLVLWDSVESVRGIYNRLETLDASGIFKGRPPAFDPAVAVWRYDIHAISRTEQQFLVDCLCEQLFYEAKEKGEAAGPDTAIIIDEAPVFLSDDDDHILTIIMREARKYGLMGVFMSQELSSFPKAFLAASTKIILGIDDNRRAAERLLGLPDGKLNFIKPLETALIQVRKKGNWDAATQFWEVGLNWDD
jgi:hypothetical protein